MTARFDWYQGTVKAPHNQVVEAFMACPEAVEAKPGRGRLNYAESVTVRTADQDTVCTILHGGNGGATHVIGTSEAAARVAETMRRHWPEHTVTRLDSAQDVLTDFDQVRQVMQRIASDAGVKGRSIVPDDPEEGATYYLGADSSPVRTRGYEKSKELAKKQGSWAGIVPGLVRLEVQVRPVREGRAAAASWEPSQVFGVTHWTRRIAHELLDLDAAKITMASRIETSWERQRRALCRQFGRHLVESVRRAGGCPGDAMEGILADIDRSIADQAIPWQ
jgi:hypothetical protein